MKTKTLYVKNSRQILWALLVWLFSVGTGLPQTIDGNANSITSISDKNHDISTNQLLTDINGHSSSVGSSQSANDVKNKFNNHITNGALPLDREITIYVMSGEAKRLYYQIHGSQSEVVLIVTPCESTIQWKLSYLPLKRPFHKERKAIFSRRRYKRRHQKYVSKTVLNNAKPMLVTSYLGTDRHTHSDVSSAPGLYVLDFNSLGKDVSVKIYVSQHYPYPLLPNEPGIELVSVRTDQVLIRWPASPSETVAPIDYCVTVSENKKLADNCLLDSYLKDDESYELDLLPTDAMTSFSFWWIRTVKNMLRQTKLKTMTDNKVRVECVGKGRTHLLPKLDSRSTGGQYFIDVYARNTVTNLTSMYRTINVTLINTEPIEVIDNQHFVIKLNQSNNFTQLLTYKSLGDNTAQVPKLWLFLQTCSGLGSVRMTAKTVANTNTTTPDDISNNQTLFTRNIFSMKTMDITLNDKLLQTDSNKNESLLLFEISSALATDRTAVFMVSNRHNRFPYPLLPDDTKLRVMATLTDCNSVTLAWNASPDDKVQYCIYVRDAHHHTGSAVIAPIDNVCANNQLISGSDIVDSDDNAIGLRKVLCKRYHKSSKRRFNNKIIQSVKRLFSGQTYVFQVLITKYRGNTLAYEQVWATTKPKYQCH